MGRLADYNLNKMIGTKITNLMLERKMTPYILSKKLNISRQQLDKYLTGTSSLNSGGLKQISDIFNISLDWLFSVEEVKPPVDRLRMVRNLVDEFDRFDDSSKNHLVYFLRSVNNTKQNQIIDEVI